MTLRLLLAVVACAALTACSPTVTVHGFAPSDDDLASLEPGIDTIYSLEERIGRPTISGLLRDDAWYYVQSTMEQLTYNAPKEVNRRVVVVTFADDGVVETVEQYGLEDGRVINLNTRVTVAHTGQKGILSQIFANVFNINADSLLN